MKLMRPSRNIQILDERLLALTVLSKRIQNGQGKVRQIELQMEEQHHGSLHILTFRDYIILGCMKGVFQYAKDSLLSTLNIASEIGKQTRSMEYHRLL